MKKRISIIAALALVSIALVAPASQAAANRYITVKAQGTVQVTPDAVRISATATNIAATSKEALAATSKSSASIRAALKSSKIDSKDIATQNISVFPEYRFSNDGGSTLVGYRASQGFTITVRAAATAGAVVDAIVAAAGDSAQINGVSPFVFSNLSRYFWRRCSSLCFKSSSSFTIVSRSSIESLANLLEASASVIGM